MWLTEYNNGIRIYKQWVSWNNKKSNQEPFWALGFKINIRLQVVASGTTRIRRQKLNRSDSTATERKHETTYFVRSWDSSFSILIRLRSGRPRFDCRNGRGCFLRHRVQTGSVVHQPPIQWVPRSLFSRVKRRGVKLTTHLHLVPRLRMRGAILDSWCCALLRNRYVLMVWYLVKHSDNFTPSALQATVPHRYYTLKYIHI
jgi:hypothetical protein